MKIVVLDGFAVNPGDMSWDFLSKYGDVEVYDKTPDSECAEKCKGADAVFTNRAKITEDLLCQCPTIKYISALGTGYDMIDINACRKHGVVVCNVPAYSSDSVAQLAFTMILNLTTDVNGLRKIVEDGKWTGIPGFKYQTIKYTELASMTLGLIGCGGIGHRVAEMAKAFKMNVAASTKTKTSGSDGIVEFMPLNEMLKISDIVSVHCPLNDETRGMIDREFISKMKDGAILINTARGAILNEADVADALNCGKLAAAGLDVLAVEPPAAENPLLSAKNCLITPHIAWTTHAARLRLLDILDLNLKSFIETGKGVNQIV